MLPTHVLVGLLIAATFVVFAPDLANLVLLGSVVGSFFPDLDMYIGHRRTLHYPTGYSIAGVLSVLLVVATQAPWLVALSFFLLGAAAHCRMDRYGGGLELRPWEGTSDRAVFDHVRGRWRSPKRWIRYDGAPEDVLLAILIGIPVFLVMDGLIRWLVVTAILIGVIYGVLRRRLVLVTPYVVDSIPDSVESHIPDRYRS